MQNPYIAQVIVPSGASGLSNVAASVDHQLVGVAVPSSWVSAALTFQASFDNGSSFLNLLDSTGDEVEISATATAASAGDNGIVLFTPEEQALFRGVRILRVRSGTAETPVNQNASRTVTLLFAKVA